MKQNRHLKLALIILVILTCQGATSAWGIPEVVSYQGILKDVDGNPLPGPVDMTFRVYDAENGGTLLWEEDHLDVQLNQGIYNVLLGNGTTTTTGSFDPSLFFEDNRWLEVVVNGEVLTPRIEFASVPFSFRAATADDVYDKDINPRSVTIKGYGPVIDSNGQWLGDPTGLQGPMGPEGPTGPQGMKGDKGGQGEQGVRRVQLV